jgi:hypothetical protein
MQDQGPSFAVVQIRPVEALSAAKDLISDQYWLFLGITFVGMLIGGAVPLGIIMGAMLCGMYICYFAKMRGETVSFEMLFKGFDHFLESLIAMLVLMGIVLALMVPLYILMFVGLALAGVAGGQGSGEAAGFLMVLVFGFFYLLVLAVSLAVGAFTMFTFPLIVDRKLKAIPALKTSFNAARANLGGVILLMLTIGVVSFLAALLCYIPVFLVMPICFGAIAVVYRQVFPEPPAAAAPSPPPLPVADAAH